MEKFTTDHIFSKAPTGIEGLDSITNGGIPRERCTLVCGSAGCGKTLMALEFLVRGATLYNEPGVFMAFEETAEELAMNVSSLGFDLNTLIAEGKLYIDYVEVNRWEIEETGEYDLEGLFIRLNNAVNKIGAKRVAMDTMESLFAGLNNDGILRAELRRLFRWIKDHKLTAIITGERGEATLTKQGLEEYVSDCVILLDHRVNDQISTRRLRVIKYRGSVHGTNEYPFLIDEDGFSVLPVTSAKLEHKVINNIVETGVAELDNMLGNGGYYRGSSVMISGTAGTAKTILSSHFVNASCKNNEKVLYFAFEESPEQLIRNMSSVGIMLQPFIDEGLLQIHSSRPTLYGLEMHLLNVYKLIAQFKPTAVIIDPMTDLISIGPINEVRSMLTRLIDMLKAHGITAIFTSLTHQSVTNGNTLTEEGVSSLIDTWIHLRDLESIGEKNRGIFIVKSRGMPHSNQIREFVIRDNGINILDVYISTTGILTGRARLNHIKDLEAGEQMRQSEDNRRLRDLERKRKILNAKISAMQAEFESAEDELTRAFEAAKYQAAMNQEKLGKVNADLESDVFKENKKDETK